MLIDLFQSQKFKILGNFQFVWSCWGGGVEGVFGVTKRKFLAATLAWTT